MYHKKLFSCMFRWFVVVTTPILGGILKIEAMQMKPPSFTAMVGTINEGRVPLDLLFSYNCTADTGINFSHVLHPLQSSTPCWRSIIEYEAVLVAHGNEIFSF